MWINGWMRTTRKYLTKDKISNLFKASTFTLKVFSRSSTSSWTPEHTQVQNVFLSFGFRRYCSGTFHPVRIHCFSTVHPAFRPSSAAFDAHCIAIRCTGTHNSEGCDRPRLPQRSNIALNFSSCSFIRLSNTSYTVSWTPHGVWLFTVSNTGVLQNIYKNTPVAVMIVVCNNPDAVKSRHSLRCIFIFKIYAQIYDSVTTKESASHESTSKISFMRVLLNFYFKCVEFLHFNQIFNKRIWIRSNCSASFAVASRALLVKEKKRSYAAVARHCHMYVWFFKTPMPNCALVGSKCCLNFELCIKSICIQIRLRKDGMEAHVTISPNLAEKSSVRF